MQGHHFPNTKPSIFSGTLIRSGNNAKTVKGDGNYLTAIMYLAPADAVAGINVCPMAVIAGCKAGCLFTAGRGRMNNVAKARANKTMRYRDNRAAFMADLVADVAAFERYCQRKSVRPAIRLNGTSDIQWEVGHPVVRDGHEYASIFDAFPNVQFYDYTKVYKRAYRKLPPNYALTLSYSEASDAYRSAVVQAAADTGANVAIVYRTKALRDAAIGGADFARHWRPVIDGDRDDLRFMDPHGVIVGLYAKGRAKADATGFVVD